MRRQDSVYNGLLKAPDDCNVVAAHDVARPLVGRNYMVQLFLESLSLLLVVGGIFKYIKITTPARISK